MKWSARVLPLLSGLSLALAACTVEPLGASRQPTGTPAAGAIIARNLCAGCHDVSDDMRAPPLRVSGQPPAFTTAAQSRGLTPARLRAFLRLPHGEMDNLELTPGETDDVVSYVISLRRK